MHPRLSRFVPTFAVALCLAGAAASAHAAEWPKQKPLTYVVPFTVGGSTDVVGRLLAQKIGAEIGQSVVVENKPGAAGAIGATYVAKAAPDGYTLFGGTISTHAINASLYSNLPYDPVKDFEPVSLVAYLPNVLLVSGNLKVDSVQDLIAYLKDNPAQRTFASSGAGTSTHLAGELFADRIDMPLSHIPYKGTPPAMLDVASGAVTFMFDQMTAALPLLESGRLKVLAVTSAERIALAPDAPTLQEAGVPDFEMASWQAVYAPKGTPKPVLDRLSQAIANIVKQPDVQQQLGQTMGMQLVGSTPDELRELMASEIPRWADLVKKSGAQAN
ncbi:tripartite tricarboxylate transporter substrate binding protein [Achromobacter sp. GG226]|uniref:Bug family tripartite tricarboxylate transporter substrate binding protein n=1 Tax=Verticiella alkaliphila TaxID=2779529 RepID=UPI001C0D6226|nr:tripartite tricarboxylate transporter substrate binding protein [Verticiella sp. GG226]MBU4609928.1 tripartite tricarboxylate transporter substrate binding protein [Verticiella sp. GG226]